MSDAIKTSQQSPPSIGLALMAWKLAQVRIFPDGSLALVQPVRREQVDAITPASAEYYHILRRIEDGETP